LVAAWGRRAHLARGAPANSRPRLRRVVNKTCEVSALVGTRPENSGHATARTETWYVLMARAKSEFQRNVGEGHACVVQVRAVGEAPEEAPQRGFRVVPRLNIHQTLGKQERRVVHDLLVGRGLRQVDEHRDRIALAAELSVRAPEVQARGRRV